MPRRGLDADTIVAAAAALADERGADAVTLTAVADAVGVKPPSLYAHVSGLDDIRARVADRGCRDLEAVLSPAVAGLSRGDALRAIGCAYRDWVIGHPGVYAIIEPAADVPAAARVLELILAVLRGYGLGDEDSIHAARALRSAIHGFTTIEAHGGFRFGLDVDVSFEWMLGVLDRGIAAAR
jgi:AcrR family transcriptional regulator